MSPTPQGAGTQHCITNAVLVLPDRVVPGSVLLDGETIIDIDISGSEPPTVIDADIQVHDWQGDFLMPGLVELHTDNLEHHVVPRPSTIWPDLLAAALAHDAELAAAGITTVFDSLRVGAIPGEEKPQNRLFRDMLGAIQHGQDQGLFRVEHHAHFRCELTDPNLPEAIEPVADLPMLKMVSLMDHTPGQRQWADLDHLRRHVTRGARSAEAVEQLIEERISRGHRFVGENRTHVLERFAHHGIAFASHDDTTLEHVEQAAAEGLHISEFPCSLEAAIAAHERGLRTLGGAPNIVRGGSHSGNVAVMELLGHDALDGLSSDYVPASLLQAAFRVVELEQMPLWQAAKLISQNNASMVGLEDRGRLETGLRADLIRVALHEQTPWVKETWSRGRRVA